MISIDLSGALWRKSSYSNGQANCVEVTTVTGGRTLVAVRDSKAPDAPSLIFTARTWRQFTGSVRATREDRLAFTFGRCGHEACLRTLKPLIRSGSKISAPQWEQRLPGWVIGFEA